MRYSILMTLIVVGTWIRSSDGQSTLDYPVGHIEPYHLDSAARDNPDKACVAVFEHVVLIEEAAWLRIYFGEVTLGEGSYIRITSLLDEELQELNEQELALWSNSSAYFNGDAVRVELIAGPRTKGHRVIIEQVAQHARGCQADSSSSPV